MADGTTTIGIEVRAEGAQQAARDLADVDASIRQVGSSLGVTSRFAGTARFDKTVAELRELGVQINTGSQQVQGLAAAMQRVDRERAFRQLASDANLSSLQLAKLRAGAGDMKGAFSSAFGGIKGMAGPVAATTAAVLLAGKACFDASLQADRLDKAYATIKGSAQGAEEQLDYLRDVSDRLGLEFYATAEAAKTFFAAGKGTELEGELNGIFEGVSSAGAALALSSDDMNGIFLALGQMLSKGKVQAEELRGQLGERLPGAFQLAAKAMGMTTAELDKAMQKGEVLASDLLPKLGKTLRQEFGDAAAEAAGGAQGAVNRLSTAWTDLKANIGDSETIITLIDRLAGALKTLAEYADLRSVSQTFTQGMELAQKGLLDFDEFTRAGFLERQRMVDDVLKPKNEYRGRLNRTVLQPEKPGGGKDAGSTKKAEAAARALEQVYVEIERLNGTGGEFGFQLSAKLQEIAKNAKAAGLSLDEAQAVQNAYSQAAVGEHYRRIASAMRDVDIEIARMTNDSATLNRLEKERDLEGQRERLLSLGVSQSEVNAKMEAYAAALEKTKGGAAHLEEQADFYEQLREKSGQYGLGIDYTNRLIERQIELWRAIPGIPEEHLRQMEELMRLEAGTDGWDGVRRASLGYYAEATNQGRQFEQFTQNMFSGFEDAFVEFAETGKFSFSDLASSIISDLVRIATQAMVIAPIVQALTGGAGGGGLLGGLFSGFTGLFSARGNVFSGGDLSDYSGSIVTGPTLFSYGSHLSAFASGAGLMGEAGPEAVMPLARASGGYLGVRAVGLGFAPRITVNLINQSGQQLQARASARPDGQGGWNVEVMLDQIEAGLVKRDAAGRSVLMNHVDRTRGTSRSGGLYR